MPLLSKGADDEDEEEDDDDASCLRFLGSIVTVLELLDFAAEAVD